MIRSIDQRAIDRIAKPRTDPLLCRTRERRDGGMVLFAVKSDGEFISVGGEDFVDDVVGARSRTRGRHFYFDG